MKECHYTVCKPCYQTCYKECLLHVCKPCYETCWKDCHYTLQGRCCYKDAAR